MQECTAVFISQEKDKEQSQKCKAFVVIASGHVDTQSRQGMLARDHISTQGTLAREHVSPQGT